MPRRRNHGLPKREAAIIGRDAAMDQHRQIAQAPQHRAQKLNILKAATRQRHRLRGPAFHQRARLCGKGQPKP